MTSSHIDSYYARTATPIPPRPPLSGDIETDICIIGGGLAGLSTALGLAERGKRVVVLEARRVAWGASGRNGGFVSAGFASGPEAVVKRVGRDHARELHALTRDAVRLVRRRIDDHAIPCRPVNFGALKAWWTDDPEAAKREQAYMAETFGVELEFWPRERLRGELVTRRYHDALYDPNAFHFHPLNYAIGIAAAVEAQDGAIYEDSAVTGMELDAPTKTISTADGWVRAKTVVIACGGYIDGLHPRLSAAVQPIATYVMVTEPLGDRLRTAIRSPYAIIDSRFDFDYYRPLADTRILWGGGITIRRTEPRRLARIMLGKLMKVYPQLDGVKVEAAWAGLMGYPTHAMPQLGEVSPGAWYCMGFGGHGMATTTMAGELIAGAIAEGDDRYRLFAPFGLNWTGGPAGLAAVQMVYWSYQFRDWLKG
ncbi:NAD(P)/FAD-dependent oxidoreductase [Rhodospirillaceae bacterium SYSU D60014]|uniref:NAD(P)/FAD-dependent oxidoreductase n=1 Tax=Virgifigura deserti TaxID=2268457 RepID=UPI000E661207